MTDNKALIDKAFKAAATATQNWLTDHPGEWFPCGFAWAEFDGRSPLVKEFKAMGREGGHKGYPTGWNVWNPSRNPTQSMNALLAGAEAFCAVLNAAGFKCNANSRMD